MKTRPRRRLGRALVRWGLVTETQLKKALRVQQERGGILGKWLIELDFIKADRFQLAVRRFHRQRRITVDQLSIDPEVTELISREVAWAWFAFPLSRMEDEILIAVPDPSVSECIKALSQATNLTVLPVSSPKGDIIRALEKHYGPMDTTRPIWGIGTPPFPKFRFETYIVGEANKKVYEAAMSVAISPGKKYNPLFIYGEVGHGKTHLLNAIGNRILHDSRDRKIVYLPAVRFADELLKAVEQNRMKDFKMAYMGIDVLLLDDVQFLADQPAVQEEFANLFEVMQARGKQIVVTSDRPPHEVKTLEERVRSRFGSGTIIGIESPNLAMKTAILMEKRREHNWRIPDTIIAKVAREFNGDVRRLEGILRTFSARIALDENVTVDELASSVLSVVQSEELSDTYLEVVPGRAGETHTASR